MKRYAPAVLAIICLSLAAAASAGEVTVGIKGGLDMFNITETPEEWEAEKDFRFAAAGGAFVNYAFNPHFSIQPELLFVMKGAKGTVDKYDVTAKFNYFELPLLLKYSFRTEGKLRPCIFAGPSVGFNVGSDLVIKAMGTSVTADFSDATAKVDMGMVAGAGFVFDLDRGALTLDIRYGMSFNKLIKGGEITFMDTEMEIGEEDAKSYGFILMAGYAF